MGNLSGWTESVLLIVAFVAVLSLVVGGFNGIYNKSYSVPLIDNTTQSLIDYQTAAHDQFQEGDVEIGTSNGITLKNSYDILMNGVNVIWTFLSGGWIPNIAIMINAGESGIALAHFLQITWIISLISGLLYVLWRVPT